MINKKVKVITFEPYQRYTEGAYIEVTPDEQFNEFVENHDIIFVDFKAYKNTLVLAYIEN